MSLAASTRLAAGDIERLGELRRTQRLATGVLVLSLAVLVGARLMEPAHPGFGFLAAFAEAAAIGGLADWYAVVALFRHPLGLPIPHTAIIPRSQQRLAESLGAFIETYFLAPEPVAAKLKEVDFAALASDWLAGRERSAGLTRFVLKLLPQALAAVDGSGLRAFMAQRAVDEIASVDAAPFAADLLSAFTDDRRHQAILDEVLRAMRRLLRDPDALDAIRDKVRDELPALFTLYRADSYILRKLVTSTFSFLAEVKADPDHPLRHEFDRFVASFVERLRTSPAYAEKAEALKRELLGRAEFAGLAQGAWDSLKRFLEQEAASPNSVLGPHIENLLVGIGRQLGEDPALRAEINRGMAMVLQAFIEGQKTGVSTFIADQVKSWDMDELIALIEINIGKDLQYIRFNGALIGGLAGLALHSVGVLLAPR